jgi:3'(2'), 5'-bisphosphate nucleotidase
LQKITKDDKSPVTVADFAVQAVVAMGLRETLGSDVNIVGEEHTQALRTDEQRPVLDAVVAAVRQAYPRVMAEQVLDAIDACSHDALADSYWTLDPVDGTKGFLRGQQYAIALALIERGTVVLGVMGCPNLPVDRAAALDVADESGCVYSAMLGEGSWEHRPSDATARPKRMQSGNGDAQRAICACESVEAGHSRQDDSAQVLSELGLTGTPARLDSQCKYAVVARGQADVYLRMPTKKGYIEKVWDHAAGAIIAQEAGAVVTDITGARLDFTHGRLLKGNRGIVCAAADVHGRVIEAIERLGIGVTV